jgi:hypothetical protein
MGANAKLTALMREAIVIQSPSCKPFGPTLNVVSTAMYVGNPLATYVRSKKGRGGGRLKAALFLS